MSEEAEYISFTNIPHPGKKTRAYVVRNIRSQALIGVIKWFGAWRQYCFFPEPNTIFSRGCMQSINEFLQRQNDEQRQGRN